MKALSNRIAISITCTPLHAAFMERCFESLAEANYEVLLGYDNPTFYHHTELPDNFRLMITEGETPLGKQWGWFAQFYNHFWYAKEMGYKYMLCTEADKSIDNVQGIGWLPEILGDGNFLSGFHENGYPDLDLYFGTVELFEKLVKFLYERGLDRGVEELFREFLNELVMRPYDLRDHLKWTDWQFDYFNAVRSDTEILYAVQNFTKDWYDCSGGILDPDYRNEAKEKELVDVISRRSVELCPMDVRYVGFVMNYDCKITPILEPVEYAPGFIQGWLLASITGRVDWVLSSPFAHIAPDKFWRTTGENN